MILTRTPLRVSLLGGGTDMPSFYENHVGAVISTAINKYIHILVNPKFDGRYRVSYSVTENVDKADEIKHDIVREVIKTFQVRGLEVVSVSDIPGEGSGLGSSSAFTVGLLRAMYAHCGYSHTPVKALAEHAFLIESNACRHPCGKQDHYAAAFGGFHYFKFFKDDVSVEKIDLAVEELSYIDSCMMLFWTGLRTQGQSDEILKQQMERVGPGRPSEESARVLADLTNQLKADLDKHYFVRLGKFVHAGWTMKKFFSNNITNDWIDQMVQNALNAEADGAKLCGAGGGGFLLVLADPIVQKAVETSVGLRRIKFHIAAPGSAVVYSGG